MVRKSAAACIFLILFCVLFLITPSANTDNYQITVRLADGGGNTLTGCSLRYYDGAWNAVSSNPDGTFTVNTAASSLTYEMTYAGGKETKSNIPTSTNPVVFQTIQVKVQLKNSLGQLMDPGTVQYYGGTWMDFGATSGGEVSKELLSYNYKFRMSYATASVEKYQNVGTDLIVVFQTSNVTVQLKNSAGQLMDVGVVQYYVGSWQAFGATSGGEVRNELLPYNYKFRMTYATALNEKYQDTGVNPTVVFKTVNVAVRLRSSQDQPLDTGVIQYYAGSWQDFGTTTNGEALKELLPYNYKFRMTYAFASNEKYQDVTTNPTVVFQTKNVIVQLKSSTSTPLDTGVVKYYAGSWNDFGATSAGQVTKELLPYNYKFRMTYVFASIEKYQDVTSNPTVVFQTKNVLVQLRDSQNQAIDAGVVIYYAGAWKNFGTTTSGDVYKELLPYNYKFRMTYAFASNEKYQDVPTNPTVVFQTIKAIVQVKSLQGYLVNGAIVKYYFSAWNDFGTTAAGEASKELLANNYKIRIIYGSTTEEKWQDFRVDPTVVFEIDAPPPPIIVQVQVFDPWDNFVTDQDTIRVNGMVNDSTATVTVNGLNATVQTDKRFRLTVPLAQGSNTITVVATNSGSSDTELRMVTYNPPILPPDPITVAPPADSTVVTTMAASTSFLYSGPSPIQTGVDPTAMEPIRAAVLRGKVLTKNNSPLPGVKVSILDRPEFGQTLTREDGFYDMAVNGGGYLTINFEKIGFLTAQRRMDVPWQEYMVLDSIVMIGLDPNVTVVDLSDTTIQTAKGSVVQDERGSRQAVMLFKPGTQAEMVMPDGSTQALDSLHMRITEYTVGDNGPATMPAPLPPRLGYTYCIEETVDEAVQAGADDVRFDPPISFYVDNFIGFPAGAGIPVGFYDKKKGVWIGDENGIVLNIVGVSEGSAQIDMTGDGVADPMDSLAVIGMTTDECRKLASLYSPGQSLWRVQMSHFSDADLNVQLVVPDYMRPHNRAIAKNESPNQCKKTDASEIGIQNQTMGENLPVTGTGYRMHYSSERMSGRKISVDIPLSDDQPLNYIKRIDLIVKIAGRVYKYSYAPGLNLMHHFVWDGKDVYGRKVYGNQVLTATIRYVFTAQYVWSRYFCISLWNGGTRCTWYTYWALVDKSSDQILREMVGINESIKAQLGGWNLDVHHSYDVNGRVLYKGDGSQRKAEHTGYIIQSVAKLDSGMINSSPQTMSFTPDGSLLICDSYRSCIQRLDQDGTLSVVAGRKGYSGFEGDGGPAIEANLNSPTDVAAASDGSYYIADALNNRIRKVDKDGIITTFAGTGTAGFSGDGGQATSAKLNHPSRLAVAPWGEVYVYDNYRLRKITSDGLIYTVAGIGVAGCDGDNLPAIDAKLGSIYDIEIRQDGSIYLGVFECRVRKISSDGIITTIAGTGASGNTGDGGQATEAKFRAVSGIAVGDDGVIYISDPISRVVRKVNADGIIQTIAGTGTSGFSGDGSYAKLAKLGVPRDVDIANDNTVYICDAYNVRVRRLTPIFKGFSESEFSVASEDGSEVYYFNAAGKHLKTVDALTGVTKYSYGYNAAGLLANVMDLDSLVTRIERDPNDVPTAVLSPFGQRTTLTLDANGYLSAVTNPAGEVEQFVYTDEGLMTRRIDPKGGISQYTYDEEGKLILDQDPAGGWTGLAYTPLANGHEVKMNTAEGYKQSYKTEKLYDGTYRMTNTNESGQATVALDKTDGTSQITFPDGTVTAQQTGPDPRFGMEAPIVTRTTVKAPSNLQSVVTQGRKITEISGLEVTGLADTVAVNGKKTISNYWGRDKYVVSTSPAGRKSYSYFDSKGRVVADSIPGILAVHYMYDDKGFLTQSRQGNRVTNFTYDSRGRLQTITDPLNRTAVMVYDSVGRVLHQTLADGRVIDYSYDANGNLTSLTPPGQPAHEFDHTPVNLTKFYGPPELPDSTGNTHYLYNLDRQIVQTMFSDSSLIKVEYDTAGCSCGGVGKPSKITFDRGMIQFKYDGVSGNLKYIVSPTLVDTLKYTYDGSLPKSVIWKGAINGNVGVSYNADFQVTSQTVNNGNSVTFSYDNDGLLTAASGLQLTRNSQNGILIGTTLGNVTTSYSYNNLGELSEYVTQYGGTDLIRSNYHLDGIGRIDTLWETTQGIQKKYSYRYDTTGRLIRVDRNDTTISVYTYDSNGNRLSHMNPSGTTTGSYDAQDRMLSYGNATFGYTATGSLQWKAENGDTTRYDYDLLGNLRSVQLPNGTYIQYLIDGQNRRIAKIVNGSIKKRWLYQNQLNIVAEFDSVGNLISRFVYGTKGHVPDYMVKNGISYRFITDHLGSVRFVVDVASGAVVQYISYDEFGNILTNTNPNFQPFGYVGGLFDVSTDLVRFGARDYNGVAGRWTAKDPIGFNSGLNLYCYTESINYIDPTGLWDLRSYRGHREISRIALENSGLNTIDYGAIIGAQLIMDGPLTIIKPFHYTPGSQNAAEEYIDLFLFLAAYYENIGQHNVAMAFIGMGLHILQDKWAHFMPRNECTKGKLPNEDDPDVYRVQYREAINESTKYIKDFTALTKR
jgi:RHS repeat-associated protein